MNKSGIDQDALVKMFSEVTAKQAETLGDAVRETTLKALQERELTLANIRKVLKTVTQAASTGTAQNPAGSIDVEQLLGKAFAGMDAALLRTVEAQRKALAQFVNQGVNVQDKHMKSALANLEQMENVFFTTVSRATRDAGDSLRAPWQHVLEAMKLKGTDTGAQASVSVEQLLSQAQAALRDGRANGVHAARAMMDSYAALVSGVLIGMSDGLQPKAAPESGRSRKTQTQA
ncbi:MULTISPECIES: DUF6781 family protein [Paraburkholderia]|uniref:Uncharacterized protein n=1 Tax=Paraburkholderia nemoris TaxID=2793076 RepID=A0ABM8T4P6_9BURK|nr:MULTISPECIES: DUF6781 family protein [Paraburkholderia]KPD15128.1 hypothetical protein ADM96_35130 [Burkholderia sp. ST111]MBK5153268.1 hypothetical protein [Burkholderia sp. R-69608]MBK5185761.1 hypothetical protein [Burkholderia sp. R-69749]MBK3744597.1 hypothetical protein [Paraburkholderia aspalathi]MBK3816265.1 hypothetical protein [Paraburkholderia aspalathi]